MSFLVRRAVVSVAQLVFLSLAISALFPLAPGDILSTELADPQRSRESVEALREATGIRQSWGRQYFAWAESSLRGNFGSSLAYGSPVGQLIAPRLRKTLQIAGSGLVLSWLLGFSGALFAMRIRAAATLDPGAAAAAMVPDVISVSVILWLGVWVGVSITGAWLPIAGLVTGVAPMIFLHSSTALQDARGLEFVRVARSRGISGRLFWFVYVLPAAANALISLAGLSVASALGSSFVVEVLTGWPGLGPLFLEAVQSRDFPIVQTVLMMLGLVLVVGNLVADLAIYSLDPRIRAGGPGGPPQGWSPTPL